MKETYLLIYTRYKFPMFLVYTLISTFGIFVQYIKNIAKEMSFLCFNNQIKLTPLSNDALSWIY